MEAIQMHRKHGWRPRGTNRRFAKVALQCMAFLVAAALSAIAGIPASASAAPPTATTEAATGVNYEQATLEGMVDPEGSPTSYWFEYGKTESYGAKIPVSPESVGSGTSNVAVSQTVTGLSQSTTYHFRVVAESEAGTTKGEDGFLKTAGFEFAFGEEGPSNGQFKQPNLGIATDSEGNIWVTDTENNRVEEFNSKGEYLSQFGKEGAGNGEFNSPKGLAIDSSDNIWVVDSGNNRVQEFNSKGEYLLKFGEKGSGNGQFNSPSGIAFDFSNRPIIVDTGNNRVEKFNSKGEFLAQVGKEGTGDAEFSSPTGIAIDPSARLWVTDTGNNRIQRFNASTFNYISQFGKKGTGNGEFNNPTGLASDFQERLWVVDSGNNRAQKFSVTTEHAGEYLDQVGKEGTGPGQFIEPTGIVAPAAQKLLILDTGNDRVQKWTVKAEAPTANTNVASNLKTTSVTLNARINPEAFATNYWFEYGLTEIYGAKVPLTPEPIGSGTSNVLVEQTVTGLSEGTKYHFRVVAKSAAGTSFGNDRTVKTCKPAPAATTEAATAIGSTQATLNGKVNPEGCTTTYWFEYGTTEAYGTKIPLIPASVGSGISSVAVSQTPAGLSKGTEYHFRVVTENAAGTSKGTDKTFTTSP
ncbi:MAG: 6-bladed beta-propeller [Solirubrobacterales bacterium]